jgi:16S rRNA (guanine527-N7)-methyltransferase
MSPDFSDLLQTLGLTLSPSQLALLTHHFNLLQKWNRKMNLTSLRRPAEILTRHFGESLFLAVHLPPASSVADVGSGAGFPGLPLAVARPELRVTLIESVAKKAAFLKEAARPIPNVRVLHSRFEDVQETFDWLAIRAVVLPPNLADRARHLALLTTRSRLDQLSGVQTVLPVLWGSDRVLALCSTWNIRPGCDRV